MLIASLYIIVCSAKNRIRTRLRRLREPRYLIGAIVGAAYLYFSFFGRRWSRSRAGTRRQQPEAVALNSFAATGPTVAGLLLMLLMTLAWIFPADSGLLEFTEAETAFLFTAPVSRRALLIHRLLRSQLGVLFAAIIPSLIFPAGGAGARLQLAIGLWIVLTTIKIHFTGITLARSSLTLRGAVPARQRWRPVIILLMAVAVVAGSIVGSFRSQPPEGVAEALDRLAALTSTGLAGAILWPFKALAAPMFAAWPGPYLLALVGALAVLLVNVAWVLQSDAALQEATAKAEARRAAKLSRERPAARARATSWALPLTGRPEGVFVWKNVMQMLRESNVATVLRYGGPLVGVTVAMTSVYLGKGQMRGAAAVLGSVAAMVAAMAVMLGPQMARTDLRQDLLHLDLLKTWPLRGAAVVRGEMIWPGVLVTAVAWIGIACAAMFWTPAFAGTTLASRLAIAIAAFVLAPALVFAQFTIHNAATVLFPAWVPLGTARPRGIDAMGQRLLMFAGIILGLIVMMAPGVAVGGIIWLAFQRWIGPIAFVPAAIACTTIVVIEVLTATEALGPIYERLDLSGIERSE